MKAATANQSVTLIGMPGSGKSTVGRILAERLGFGFLDGDALIEHGERKKLWQLIQTHGLEGFLDIESRYAQSIRDLRTVIAPGGSVVYRRAAVEHFRSLGPVVYLEVELSELQRRLADLAARGVAIAPGRTLTELYAERCPLYEQAATLKITTTGLSPDEIAWLIEEKLFSS